MPLRIAHIIPHLYRILGEGAGGRHQEAGSRGVSSLPDSTGLTADPITDCPGGAVASFQYREQKGSDPAHNNRTCHRENAKRSIL